MALANCLEMVIVNGSVFNLSTFEFNGKFTPAGFTLLKRFSRDTGVHFYYRLPQFNVTKSVYLLRDMDMAALVYDFTTVKNPMEFVLRPFIGLRDFHSLQKSYARISAKRLKNGLLIRHDTPGSCELFLRCPSMTFEKDQQWWFNFTYRNDKERGQDFTEDLWTPGFFKGTIETAAKIVFWANLGISGETASKEVEQRSNIETLCEDLRNYQNSLIAAVVRKTPEGGNTDEKLRKLYLAADQFIAKRRPSENSESRTTILAGFPW
jgi:predicted glycogen debranching enzyme